MPSWVGDHYRCRLPCVLPPRLAGRRSLVLLVLHPPAPSGSSCSAPRFRSAAPRESQPSPRTPVQPSPSPCRLVLTRGCSRSPFARSCCRRSRVRRGAVRGSRWCPDRSWVHSGSHVARGVLLRRGQLREFALCLDTRPTRPHDPTQRCLRAAGREWHHSSCRRQSPPPPPRQAGTPCGRRLGATPHQYWPAHASRGRRA